MEAVVCTTLTAHSEPYNRAALHASRPGYSNRSVSPRFRFVACRMTDAVARDVVRLVVFQREGYNSHQCRSPATSKLRTGSLRTAQAISVELKVPHAPKRWRGRKNRNGLRHHPDLLRFWVSNPIKHVTTEEVWAYEYDYQRNVLGTI